MSSAVTPIPVYRIDLGLPPEERYAQLASDFAVRMRAVIPLYEEILSLLLLYRPLIFLAKLFVRCFLRRVWDPEQTREIRAISRVAGIDLSLVVVLNTLLDSLLGCTSGAITVRNGHAVGSAGRLLHFRTLDWGMPALRDLLVVLEFVDSSSGEEPGRVLARSITYAGFVGSLTGARPGMSFSLNHRPLRTPRTRALALHQLGILLGRRESISSRLRRVLLAPKLPAELGEGIEAFSESFAQTPSPPCYLIFCTPLEASVIQKDHVGGRIKSSRDFIVQANHDTDHRACCGAAEYHHPVTEDAAGPEMVSGQVLGAETWIEESAERQDAMHSRWIAHSKKRQSTPAAATDSSRLNGVCIRSAAHEAAGDGERVSGITRRSLEQWMTKYPIVNECTHFVTIMDPHTSEILFLERGPDEPIEEE